MRESKRVLLNNGLVTKLATNKMGGYIVMEYTPIEKQTLDMMKRTDFKNLSKIDVLSIVSKLSELRPDVAKEIIAQFPEFAKLIQSSMAEYRDILGNIISSDDDSIKQVYATVDRNLDVLADSRKQLFDYAEKVHADLSKCLDNEQLSHEERKFIYDKEMEIFKIVSEKDAEIRSQEREMVQIAEKKDSEKRQLNWNIVKVASSVLMAGLVIGVSVLGGNVNIKLPKKS